MWLRTLPITGVLLLTFACTDAADPDPQGGGGTATGGTGGTGLTGTGTGTGTGPAGGSGGATGGSGGATGGGGGATGGMGGGGSSCTAVTLGALELTDTEPGGSSLAYALDGLAAGQEHYLFLEFFDVAGAQTAGSFDVSQPPDDNYSTCAHCVLVFEDFNAPSPTAYFSDSGSIVVSEPDGSYTGESSGTLTGLRLIEVTLNGAVTTPVPDGGCLVVANGPWDTTP